MARLINKPYVYEKHALRRLEQRDICRLDVEQTVAAPDSRAPAKRTGAWRAKRRLNATEELSVIYEENADFIRIVTAWVNHV